MKTKGEETGKFDKGLSWAMPALLAFTPFFVFWPMRPTEQQGFYLAAATALLAGSLGVAWIAGARALPRGISLPGAMAALIVFSGLVSILASGERVFGLEAFKLPLCGLALGMMMLVSPLRRAIVARTTALLAAGSVALAVYGIAQSRGCEFLNYSEDVQKNAVVATIGHPNFLASFLGPMFFFMVGWAFSARRPGWRAAAGAGALLVAACLALARARAATLGMVFGCGVAGCLIAAIHARGLAPERRRRAWGIGAAGLACVIVAGLMVIRTERFGAAFERLLASNELNSRMFYWKAAIAMGDAQPLLGQGVGMFDAGFWPFALEQLLSDAGRYQVDVLPAIVSRAAQHPHNEYLEAYAEQGWAGVAPLLGLLVYYAVFGARAAIGEGDKARGMFLACCCGGLAMSMADAGFGFPWRLPASVLAMVCVAAQLQLGIAAAAAEEEDPQRDKN